MTPLLIFFILMSLDAGFCTETSDQILSVTPKTQEQVDILTNVSMQHETILLSGAQRMAEETPVQLFVPADSSETIRDLLQKHNITHSVLIANATEMIEMQRMSDPSVSRSSSDFYERYHNLEDIYEWIKMIETDNPTTVKSILIGHSTEQRPLYVLKLSLNNTPNKKAMWIDCGIHAREWISHAFCLWFVHHSLTSYQQNPEITQILDNMDVYVLPVLNPDGYKYTWTTAGMSHRMWRKNRSVNSTTTCMGVDLNRNFDAKWCTEGASPDPCSDTYCGAFPESEPESKAVADFLRSHKDSIQIYLSIHAHGQMLLFPYSYTCEKTENHDALLEMAYEAAQKIKSFSGNIYTYGRGADAIYMAPGGSDDWAYDTGIKYSFTFELQDRDRYFFLLPPSHISGACQEALIALKTIALKVIEKTQTQTGPLETVAAANMTDQSIYSKHKCD